jgi:ribosome-binding protein aMBF1 (putative translation factor)
MTKVKDLHRGWMKDPKYKAEYDALDEEFQLARTLIKARTHAGLSQTQLARRMKTSQSYVARIDGTFVVDRVWVSADATTTTTTAG